MKVMKNDSFFDLSIIFMKQIQIVIFEEMQDNYNALERNGLSLCMWFLVFQFSFETVIPPWTIPSVLFRALNSKRLLINLFCRNPRTKRVIERD